MTIDPAYILSNRIEAALWIAIGLAFVIVTFVSRSAPRTDCLVAAVVFLAFGCSDLVETHTGAWWRPWWLLVWKGVCVVTFVALLVRHYKRKSTTGTTTEH
jgi:hypothetical protein